MRFIQVAGVSLTAQQPLNNISRVTIQAQPFAAEHRVYIQIHNEAIGLPTEESNYGIKITTIMKSLALLMLLTLLVVHIMSNTLPCIYDKASMIEELTDGRRNVNH